MYMILFVLILKKIMDTINYNKILFKEYFYIVKLNATFYFNPENFFGVFSIPGTSLVYY